VNPVGSAECGADCFNCHKVETITSSDIEEHKVIKECRECHLKKIIFNQTFTPNGEESLRTLLKFK